MSNFDFMLSVFDFKGLQTCSLCGIEKHETGFQNTQFCKGIRQTVQEHTVVTQKVYWDYCISVLTICFCYHREFSAWAIRLINRLLINIVKVLTFFTVDLKAKAEVVKGITVLMKFKKQNKKNLKNIIRSRRINNGCTWKTNTGQRTESTVKWKTVKSIISQRMQ